MHVKESKGQKQASMSGCACLQAGGTFVARETLAGIRANGISNGRLEQDPYVPVYAPQAIVKYVDNVIEVIDTLPIGVTCSIVD